MRPEPDSGALTVAGKRSAADPPASSVEKTQPGSHRGTETLTPERALQADEVARTRLFMRVCAVLAGVLLLVVPFVSGGRRLRVAVGICCAIVVVVSLWFARTLRDERHYTQTRWLMVSYVLMATTSVGMLYIGIFSPAPMVGTLGIYFVCLGSSQRVAIATWLTGATMHLAPALLVATGAIRDPGLFTSGNVTGQDQLVALLLVQVVYALTFVLARGSRRATRNAVERLHQALAQVQKREALLAEAHLDLDRALKGGFAGRWSERRLGPYLLGDVIGRGAMSEVYRASHPDGTAAVKVLHRDLAVDPAQVRRFLREAEIVSTLKSPHVVRVLSFGNFGARGDDPPYIAMELLDGHDLAWHLRRERRMQPERVMEMIDHLAHALSEAEAAEVVHRDLKPQNIFCVQVSDEAPRSWKVLDFGVSKLESSSGTLTKGQIVGTPGYMAPEQARGGEVGTRADVFSLAAIAYRALTGRPAFSGKDMPRVLFDVCYVQPMRPSRLASIPEDVERVLAFGLAKRQEERLPTARAFADALRAAFAGRLDDTLRRRAQQLLDTLPWGTRPPA